MRLVRVAVANVNTTVGAHRSNVDHAIEAGLAAASDGAMVVAFPEQLVGGYAPEDLVQWRAFVDDQWPELLRFAKATAHTGALHAVGVSVLRASNIYNCAALVHRGAVLGLVPKEKLPAYNVFYETRTFARGLPGLMGEVHGVPFGDMVFDTSFGVVALEVCEDLWTPEGPMRRRAYAGAELVVNLSASPFRLGFSATRREVIATRTHDNQATLVYTNVVGANDGLVFDGGGFVAQNGRIVLEVPRFREGVTTTTVDLDRTRRLRAENTTWRQEQEAFMTTGVAPRRIEVPALEAPSPPLTYPVPSHGSFFLPAPTGATVTPRVAFCEELLDALALGVGDYFEKTGAFRTLGVALSGGRDSLLCLLIARRYVARRYASLDAAGRKAKARELLRAFFLPTRFSSAETHAAAVQVAKDLDVPLVVLDIDDAFSRELDAASALLQPGEAVTPAAKQNLQARIRAERMWTWANSAAGLLLQTSNMSEKAVGYTTIGGDMEGALAVIANVPKTVVNYLLQYLLETTGLPGIALTLEKPASAELADDQEDERDLMPFPVLDACFALYAGEKMDLAEVAQVLRAMFPTFDGAQLDQWAAKFGRLFTASIYKWVQTPLSLHVGHLDLDRERALQLPVVQGTQWGRAPGTP